jgi:hypothetical protein
MGWWILIGALFLAAQAGWRSAPEDSGAVRVLDGNGGQPPTPRAP